MAVASISFAIEAAWWQIDFVINLSVLICGASCGTLIILEFSTALMISVIFWITLIGCFPTEVSPESITASAPSIIEFATSFTSALVGTALSIIVSIICVAIITGILALFARLTNFFWINGTSCIGISTPKSPRATIKPSQ